MLNFFPETTGSQNGVDLRFPNAQPDTSLHYETIDRKLMHRAVCLLTFHFRWIYCFYPLTHSQI